MSVVLDASATLAFLADEPGAATVAERLDAGDAYCSAANWSEVVQKLLRHQRNWQGARAAMTSFGMKVEPVTRADAEWAAHRWRPDEGLSLADRLCLALGDRLGLEILTADRSWGRSDRITQIR